MSESRTLPCPWPGCVNPRPERRPNGYQPKWCEEHRRPGSAKTLADSRTDCVVTLTCFRCSKSFERPRANAKRNKSGRHFCSNECRNTVGSKPRKGDYRECATCEGLFYARATSRAVTCSRECSNTYKARNQIKKTCETCGEEMSLPQCLAARRFCSDVCSGHADTKVTLTCEWCENEYRGRPQEGRRFCSKPCFYAWQTENATGSIDSNGYRLITAPDGTYRKEHRVVMERVLGRALSDKETVHHLDADRLNNDPSNLCLMISDHPKGAAIGDLIKAYEARLRQLRRDLRKLEEAGAGTSMTDSHLFSPDDPSRELALFDSA